MLAQKTGKMREFGIIELPGKVTMPVNVVIGNEGILVTPVGTLNFGGNRLVSVEYALAAAEKVDEKVQLLKAGDSCWIPR